MSINNSSLRNALDKDGYAIIRQLLTPAEVERLRSTLSNFFNESGVLYHLGKTQPNASIEVPELSWLFSHPNVVRIFKEALGDGPVFTGHCDIHQDMFSDWHKDTGRNDSYFTENCFVDDCNVLKMAFYLQDHEQGDGLSVRKGSQGKRNFTEGEVEVLRTAPGDAVIFDVRLTHRGRVPDGLDKTLHLFSRAVKKGLKMLPFKSLHKPGDLELAYRLRRLYSDMRGQRKRFSIFFTYGANNRFSRQFSAANMKRQLNQYESDSKDYPQGLEEALARQNVTLVRH